MFSIMLFDVVFTLYDVNVASPALFKLTFAWDFFPLYFPPLRVTSGVSPVTGISYIFLSDVFFSLSSRELNCLHLF